MIKKYILCLCLALACLLTFSGCGFHDEEEAEGDNVVYVYNWGDYIDPDTLEQFEEETGIHIVMDEFDTNESMYPLVAAGAVRYDVICPSDYMIQKMIKHDLLQPSISPACQTPASMWDRRFTNSRKPLTREISIPYRTAGGPSESCTTAPWSMIP